MAQPQSNQSFTMFKPDMKSDFSCRCDPSASSSSLLKKDTTTTTTKCNPTADWGFSFGSRHMWSSTVSTAAFTNSYKTVAPGRDSLFMVMEFLEMQDLDSVLVSHDMCNAVMSVYGNTESAIRRALYIPNPSKKNVFSMASRVMARCPDVLKLPSIPSALSSLIDNASFSSSSSSSSSTSSLLSLSSSSSSSAAGQSTSLLKSTKHSPKTSSSSSSSSSSPKNIDSKENKNDSNADTETTTIVDTVLVMADHRRISLSIPVFCYDAGVSQSGLGSGNNSGTKLGCFPRVRSLGLVPTHSSTTERAWKKQDRAFRGLVQLQVQTELCIDKAIDRIAKENNKLLRQV